MKYIEIDDELYGYIAGNTQRIGESASDILRRLLGLEVTEGADAVPDSVSQPGLEQQESPVVASISPRRKAKLEAVRSSVSDPKVFDALLEDRDVVKQKGAVGRFLYLLDSLYRQHPGAFEGVLQIKGRDRLYFSQSEAALLKASKSTNPKQIGASPYWVSTNNNTPKKRAILSEVLLMLGCPEDLIEHIVARI